MCENMFSQHLRKKNESIRETKMVPFFNFKIDKK